ncbi:retrovirus-related pol polyprotein from transposon TNT 1-94 [Tanacetum coccineum]
MPKSHTRNHRILPSKSVNARRAADHNRKLNVVDHNQFVIRSLKSVNTKTPQAKHSVNHTKKVWKATRNHNVNTTKTAWRPTGKVVGSVKPQWKPTGRHFALYDNCPLTRIMEPIVEPLELTPSVSSSSKVTMISRSKGRTVADSIAERLTRPTAYKFKTDCSIIPVWVFYDNNLKQALGFQNPFYLKKTQQIRPMMYDGNVIAKETNVISIADSEETLMLEEESRSKMFLKQNFGKRFVPQRELSNEKFLHPIIDQSASSPVKIKAPRELPNYHVDKQCFEIQKKQFLFENERLLDQIISQDIVNSSVDPNTSVNVNSSVAMIESVNYVEMCNKCLELEAELIKQHNMLQAKGTTIKKSKAHIKRVNETSTSESVKKDLDEIETINIEQEHRVTRLIAENEHLKQTYKQLYDLIKPSRVRAKEQTESLVNQVNQKKLKGKDTVDNAAQMSNATTMAPGMYKLGPIILAPQVKNNRETHEYYLKHTMEQAAILRELIQELLSYVRDTCPDIHKPSEKLVAVMPINKKKTVQFANTAASSSNMPKVTNKPLLSSTGVKPSTSAIGSKPSGKSKNDRISRAPSSTEKNKVEHPVKGAQGLCSVCNECLFDANHAMCLIDHVNSINVRDKSASKKNKKRKEWKPTGKMFNSVGYKWKPTGMTFTFVGNACPLTRITATNKVPLRVPIPLEVVAPEHVVTRVYTRRPKVPKSVPNSKPKLAKSMTANIMEPSTSRGSDTLVAPSSSSLIDCRFSKLFCGNITISRVYYVEGLGHNLFSVGQFCDSDLEVAFRKHTCFVRNLEGIDLLSGSRGTNLYSLSIGHMMASSPICLLNGLVRGLPRLKFEKDYLCSACAMGKSKKQSHKPKYEDTNQEKLYLLHMDLCGPMRVASVNGKKYILFIVDDYSRFTWVKFLASKDEAPDFIIKFLKMIQVRLNATVRNIRTDNGTEFVNQTLRDYYEQVGISHETSVARTPQQNGVVERRNRTLVEAARTMLIYAKAPLFLWAEAVATACYTQNRSIIRRRHGKTPYELLHDRKPDLSYLHVFGALCYPNNDSENLGKLQAKADIGIFIGYAPKKKAYRIYNRRTRKIIETIHVDFDELTTMASEQSSLEPALHEMTPATPSSGLVPNPPPSAPFVPPSRKEWDLVFHPVFDEFYSPPTSVASPVPVEEAPAPVESTSSPSSTSVDQDAPSPKESHDLEVAHMSNDPYFGIPIPETISEESSSSDVISTTVHPDAPISEHPIKWTKDHLIKNIIGKLSRPVSTRLQLHEQALFCYYDAFLTSVEPKTYKEALTHSCWIEAMQEELNEFERLEVWELVPP